MKKILVTGAAGFIGFHLVCKLLERGDQVLGLDVLNDYYEVALKYARLAETGIDQQALKAGQVQQSSKFSGYQFVQLALEDKERLQALFEEYQFDAVMNLAAQPGVRYSLENPYAYIDSNVVGFLNLLEACRHHQTGHLVFASSSSVYGLNETIPYATQHNVDHPISLYAATKKSNELMAHTYSHLYQLPTTGLRFFTVYGPWGRPDMAIYLFTRAVFEGKTLKVFNHGKMVRDFTYVDDIVEGVVRVLDKPPKGNPDWNAERPDPSSSPAPYRIYNIGNNEPVKLMDFIEAIESAAGRKAPKEFLPIQPGDVQRTYADVGALERDFGYKPTTDVRTGVQHFVDWYRRYYKIEV
ncbi:MAG TPA: NAD-dependent epimerase [Saprospiraceae bacterium]|nr:NAD-dependent epimerase [Saprospiraceae bacterium]